MQQLNRDLLVVTKKFELNREELEQTIGILNELLYHVESFASTCIANEIFDLNRYKILNTPQQVAHYIKTKLGKPFVFISSKN